MPKKKSVYSLKRYCLRNIAFNMENYWCSDFKNFADQVKGQFTFVIGPFEYMLSDLVHGLMQELVGLHRLKRHHLHLLLHSRIESLDLSLCKMAANTDSIISLVARRCTKLTKLDISWFNQVSVQTLLTLVTNLSNIQCLRLRFTKCNDKVLQAIGSNCLDLRELDVKGCPISDNGILNLCFSLKNQHQKCSKLIKLDISYTEVTSTGAQEILLSAQNLRQLELYSLCDAMTGTSFKEKLDKKLLLHNLSNAFYMEEPYPVQTIRTVTDLCPLLTEVKLFQCVDDEGVQCLSSLQNLRVLHLANSDDELITFDGSIVPVLATRGQQIQELALHEINSTDIGFIGMTCPNLQVYTYAASVFGHVEFRHTEQIPQLDSQKMYSFLKKLDVQINSYCSTNNLTRRAMTLMLQNAHDLEEFNFCKISCLTDDLFMDIITFNNFSQLKKAKLCKCDNITETFVWELLRSDTPLLCEVSLIKCKEITCQNYEAFKRYAKKNHLETMIEWT